MPLSLHCPCCNNSSNKYLYKLKYGGVYICAHCNTAYTVFDDLSIKSANEVFGSSDFIKARIYEQHRLRRIARNRLSLLKRYLKEGHVLEFGSSTGEFIYECTKSGYNVSSVDLYSSVLKSNQPGKSGDVYRQDASEFKIEETYDAVVAFHVIEHLLNPGEFLRNCRGILKPDGIIFLEVPNYGSLSRRIWRKRWGMFYDYHVCHFDSSSLAGLLKKHGYQILLIRTVDDQIRYIAPFYNPLRNALWAAIRKVIHGKRAGQNQGNDNNNSIDYTDEERIRTSWKAKIYRLELYIVDSISLLFLPFSLLLNSFGSGSYIQVIAKKNC